MGHISVTNYRQTRRGTRPRKSELAFRRINALNLHRGAPINQQFSESSVAAANIDPSQTRWWRQPIEEDFSGRPTPDPHRLLVGSAVIETNIVLDH
jgi:hypothetical protein